MSKVPLEIRREEAALRMSKPYYFNPDTNKIVPSGKYTKFLFPKCANLGVSAKLYSAYIDGRVSKSDIAAMFAAGRDPEILLKNAKIVKESPQVAAPALKEDKGQAFNEEDELAREAAESRAVLPEDANPFEAGGEAKQKPLVRMNHAELMAVAAKIGIDLSEIEAPTRQKLIELINARADAAQQGE